MREEIGGAGAVSSLTWPGPAGRRSDNVVLSLTWSGKDVTANMASVKRRFGVVPFVTRAARRRAAVRSEPAWQPPIRRSACRSGA